MFDEEVLGVLEIGVVDDVEVGGFVGVEDEGRVVGEGWEFWVWDGIVGSGGDEKVEKGRDGKADEYFRYH